MQTQINKELAALMQLDSVEQAIKTLLSSGVAPGTVAAQKVQETAALTQAAPQSQAAPPGIEALLPGVQQQAAQAAQAAQPATQGDVNQLRQMLAQAQQGQGVAGLPGADVRMAEGGVVGYSGLDGSAVEVDDTKLSVGERFRRDMRRLYERTGLAAKRAEYLQRAGATPEMVAKTLATESARPTPDAAPITDTGDEYAKLLSKYRRPTTPQEIEAQVQSASGASYQPDARLFRSAAQKVLPAANVKPAETGLPALMGPPVPTGSERQFGEAMAAQGRMEIPAERTAQQIRKQTEDYYRSLGIDPDFAKQRMERIAAQERRDQEEAAARAALVKDRGIENLISRLSRVQGPTLFSGLGAAQRGMEPIVAEQRASDERFRALMRERQREADRERAAIEDVQRALADGDIARAEKSRSEALAARNAKAAAEAEMRGRYAPQLLQAETAALDRASREREGAEGRKTQLQVAQIGVSKPTAREFDYALFKANPEKYKEFLAAGAEPKSEGAMLKEIVGAVLKNPLMMQQYPPAIQALVTQELLKLGVTPALPKGAPVRE